MSYRVTDKMPEEGQFIAVWEDGGLIWSGVFDIASSGLRKYDNDTDQFLSSRLHLQAWGTNNPDVKNVVFIASEDK